MEKRTIGHSFKTHELNEGWLGWMERERPESKMRKAEMRFSVMFKHVSTLAKHHSNMTHFMFTQYAVHICCFLKTYFMNCQLSMLVQPNGQPRV